MNITYQKGFKFGAAVTSLGMYYTSNKICPRIQGEDFYVCTTLAIGCVCFSNI